MPIENWDGILKFTREKSLSKYLAEDGELVKLELLGLAKYIAIAEMRWDEVSETVNLVLVRTSELAETVGLTPNEEFVGIRITGSVNFEMERLIELGAKFNPGGKYGSVQERRKFQMAINRDVIKSLSEWFKSLGVKTTDSRWVIIQQWAMPPEYAFSAFYKIKSSNEIDQFKFDKAEMLVELTN